MKNPIKAAFTILSFCFFYFVSCKKAIEPTSQNKAFSVYLTDDPTQYDSVLVDIRYVEVKVDLDDRHENDDQFGENDKDEDDDHMHIDQYGKWDTLSLTPRVYNVSSLRNGINTIIGSGNITNKVRKIRITLGTNNFVFKSGVKSPLNLLPGKNNYLYVKIHEEDEDDDDKNVDVFLDFDLSASIVEQNGQFYLKPVLKPFGKHHFGIVKGKVFPPEAHTVINVSNNQDTKNAIPEKSGEFEIQGLHAGTYSVQFHSFNGYRDTTINNVVVKVGMKTELPNITLRK